MRKLLGFIVLILALSVGSTGSLLAQKVPAERLLPVNRLEWTYPLLHRTSDVRAIPPSATSYDTLRVTNGGKADTTIVYNAWGRIGLMLDATQENDSNDFKIEVWAGRWNKLDSTWHVLNLVDSVFTDVDGPTEGFYDGGSVTSSLGPYNVPGCDHVMYIFKPIDATGADVKITGFVWRNRY